MRWILAILSACKKQHCVPESVSIIILMSLHSKGPIVATNHDWATDRAVSYRDLGRFPLADHWLLGIHLLRIGIRQVSNQAILLGGRLPSVPTTSLPAYRLLAFAGQWGIELRLPWFPEQLWQTAEYEPNGVMNDTVKTPTRAKIWGEVGFSTALYAPVFIDWQRQRHWD